MKGLRLWNRLLAVPLVLAAFEGAGPRDWAAWLPGTWSCQSLAHTVSTMSFGGDAGAISMHNAYRTADGVQGSFDEAYRFDRDSGKWVWSTRDSVTGSTETGTAAPWTGKNWTFSGTRQTSATHGEQIQMIYTRLSGDSFRRDFRIDRDGTFQITSSSVCKRQQ